MTCVQAAIFALFAVSLGCSQVTREKVQQITLNKTTDADLITLFGKPKIVDQLSDGNDSGTKYVYSDGSWGNIGPYVWLDYFWFGIETKNNHVTAYVYACDNGDQATRFDGAKFAQIVDGVTTREQAIALLGPPTAAALKGTQLEELRLADRANFAELIAWVDAPQVKGLFKVSTATITIHILRIGTDHRVQGKAARTITVNP